MRSGSSTRSRRGFRQLPNDKGQAARDLTAVKIVNGILAMMDARPGFAGLAVICMKKLKPVRGAKYSYRGAQNFGEAVRLLLEYPEELLEVRVKGIENDDRGVPPYAHGSRAQITYETDGGERMVYFDPRDSLCNENSKAQNLPGDPQSFDAGKAIHGFNESG